jgi:hypothetical protein
MPALRPVIIVAAVIFALLAVAHLTRLLNGWQVIIDSWSVPAWVSVLGVIVPGLLAVMLWHEGSRPRR